MLNKKNTITLLTFIAIVLMLVACSSETQSPIDDGGLTVEEEQPIDDGGLVAPVGVEDTAWKLLAIRDFDALIAADMDSTAIIEFKADGTFHMSTGCGEMGGSYTIDGETISFEVAMTTSAADCTELQVAQALAVESLMQDVTSYSISDETLTLSVDENNDAKFEQLHKIDDGGLSIDDEQPIDDGGLVAPVGVEDTAWKLLAIRDFDAQIAADMDSTAIIEFKADGTFHMSTGCGEMGGIYTLDGETISFEVQMTTVVADCTEIQVAQALAIESLMQDVTSYSTSGETLTLSIDENNDAKFEQLHKIDDDGLVDDGGMNTEFVGITWKWLELHESLPATQSIIPDSDNYTIEFSDDGSFSVKADCNNASGSYTMDGDELTLQLGPATLAECGESSIHDLLFLIF